MVADNDDKKKVISATDIMAEIDELISTGGAAESKPPIVSSEAGSSAQVDDILKATPTAASESPSFVVDSAPVPDGAKFCFSEYTRYKVLYSKEVDKELKKIYALSMKAMKFVIRNVYGKDMLKYLGDYS